MAGFRRRDALRNSPSEERGCSVHALQSGAVRVVSLLPSATEVIAELGLLDSLVGVSEDSNWPPDVSSKPVVAHSRIDGPALTSAQIDALVRESVAAGGSLYAVDAELLDELRPDLVVTQDLCEVCAVSSGDLATACPIATETLSLDPQSLDEVAESVIVLAERLGVRARGERLAATMRSAIDAVRAVVAGLRRPRVFVAEWIDPPFTAGHWVPEMVEAAGGTNLLGKPREYSVATRWESVLAEQPDLVVIAACGYGFAEAHDRAEGLRLPVRTVVVDGDAYFSRPAPRLAEGVRQLAHLLHPDVVPDPGAPYAELPRALQAV
jgi:iron complex transport system substrate-binding protein